MIMRKINRTYLNIPHDGEVGFPCGSRPSGSICAVARLASGSTGPETRLMEDIEIGSDSQVPGRANTMESVCSQLS